MKKYILPALTLACGLFLFTNAKAQTTTRPVSGYTGIDCNGPFNVTIKIDGTESLTLDVDAGVEKDITTEVKHGILTVELKDGWKGWKKHGNIKRANIYISAKNLSYLGSGGSGNTVLAAGSITGDHAQIEISGSGNLTASVKGEDLEISASGSGSAVLKGSGSRARVSVSGSGQVNGKDLAVKTVEARISGSGNIRIIANEAVSAQISGSGGLEYSGTAKNVHESHSGSGRISKVD